MQARLYVSSGRYAGETFRLSGRDKYILGRSSRCDLVLDDVGVSRFHCILERNGSILQVVDLNSSNGTYVNGSPARRRELVDGDTLAVGKAEMVFSLLPEESIQPSPAGAAAPKRASATTRRVPGPDESDGDDPSRFHGRLLHRLLLGVTDGESFDAALDLLADLALETLGCERVFLYARNPLTGALEVVRARVVAYRADEMEIRVAQSVLDRCLATGEPFQTQNAMADGHLVASESVAEIAVRAAMVAPARWAGEIAGMLYADNLYSHDRFSDEQLSALALIARQAGPVLSAGGSRAQDPTPAFLVALETVLSVSRAQPFWYRRDARVVGEVAVALARRVGVSTDALKVVGLAALLLDLLREMGPHPDLPAALDRRVAATLSALERAHNADRISNTRKVALVLAARSGPPRQSSAVDPVFQGIMADAVCVADDYFEQVITPQGAGEDRAVIAQRCRDLLDRERYGPLLDALAALVTEREIPIRYPAPDNE